MDRRPVLLGSGFSEFAVTGGWGFDASLAPPAPAGPDRLRASDGADLRSDGTHANRLGHRATAGTRTSHSPADEAAGGLAVFRTIFPGAKTLMFGFGKRTFMIAPVHSMADLIIGPFPGNAAIQVSAVSVTAARAFPDLHVATLRCPQPARPPCLTSSGEPSLTTPPGSRNSLPKAHGLAACSSHRPTDTTCSILAIAGQLPPSDMQDFRFI